MAEFSQAEATEILKAMTKSGVKFDGAANKQKGALVFTNETKEFMGAYVKAASISNGYDINIFEVSPAKGKTRYEIHNEDTVKAMCGYCDQSRGAQLA